VWRPAEAIIYEPRPVTNLRAAGFTLQIEESIPRMGSYHEFACPLTSSLDIAPANISTKLPVQLCNLCGAPFLIPLLARRIAPARDLWQPFHRGPPYP
jgi:hypothetical protein